MATFNPKIPKFKFDPSKYSLTPKTDFGFNIPSLEIPDYQAPSLPPAKPEPWGGRTDFSDEYRSYSTEDFSGIEPYTMPTETRKTTPSRTSSYPTTTRTSAYTPSRSYQTSTRQAAPIPYGSQSFWQPGKGAMPTMGALPEYTMPKMDRARIGELTELSMGAPMGRLKEGLNRALLEARYSTNPMVRAMARRQALSGYGGGITDVRTGAHREAMGEYMPEYQSQLAKSQAEYQTKTQRIRDQFQSDMQDYIRRGKQITTPIGGRRETADPRYKISWRV